jgi:hypothetical protein
MWAWSGPDGWKGSRWRLRAKSTPLADVSDAGLTPIELFNARLVRWILLAFSIPGLADRAGMLSTIGRKTPAEPGTAISAHRTATILQPGTLPFRTS